MPDVEPIATFTRQHPTTGEKQTRDAYAPDEVVNLTADGWVQKPSKSTGSAPSTPPAGGRQSGS